MPLPGRGPRPPEPACPYSQCARRGFGPRTLRCGDGARLCPPAPTPDLCTHFLGPIYGRTLPQRTKCWGGIDGRPQILENHDPAASESFGSVGRNSRGAGVAICRPPKAPKSLKENRRAFLSSPIKKAAWAKRRPRSILERR